MTSPQNRPEMCAHDGGGEFIGPEFQALLYSFGIHHDIRANAYNPQGNSICERMHKDVGNTLTCLVQTHKPRTLADAKNYVDSALATCMYTLRANVSRATGNSPRALAFYRDMIMNIPLQADLCAIRARRQLQVDDNIMRANARQYDFDYQPGQKVLKKRHTFRKIGECWNGPYKVLCTYVNGNLTIEFMPGVTERLNIRRFKPYFEKGFRAS